MFLRVAFCGISVVLVFRVLLDMLCMKAAELADRLVIPREIIITNKKTVYVGAKEINTGKRERQLQR